MPFSASPTHWLLVIAGGGLGAALRHAVGGGIEALRGPQDPARFPIGTLAANVLGCLAIGLVAAWAARREPARLFVVVGLLGGFTTFSSFAYETVRLVAAGHAGKAALYVLATNAAALAACGIVYRGGAAPVETE